MTIDAPFEPYPSKLLRALAQRISRCHTPGQRCIIGLIGKPGAGKSTLAKALLPHLSLKGALLPMDGFHLANCQLERLDRTSRKGAPDTFDVQGYTALLQRLRPAHGHHCLYAPSFERHLEEPIAGAIAIEQDIDVVITEGNYLLLETDGWQQVAEQLDECWYLEPDDHQRRKQLIARHQHFGRSHAEALEWATHTDEPNARLIAACKSRADHVIRIAPSE